MLREYISVSLGEICICCRPPKSFINGDCKLARCYWANDNNHKYNKSQSMCN